MTNRFTAALAALDSARRKHIKMETPTFGEALKKFVGGYGGARGAQWDQAIGDTQRSARRMWGGAGAASTGTQGALLGAIRGMRRGPVGALSGALAGGAIGGAVGGGIGYGSTALRQGLFNRGLRNRLAYSGRSYGSDADTDRSYNSALVAQGRRSSGLHAAMSGPAAPLGYAAAAANHGIFRNRIRNRMGM